MYSPIITIDPKKIARMMDTDAFEVPLKKFVQVFKQFEPSLFEEGNETELYKIIKNYSKNYPDKDVKWVIQKILPKYTAELRAKQSPIFEELDNLAENLPEEYKYQYKLLKAETRDRLDYKPIALKFSKKDFLYKLDKINEYHSKRKNPKIDRIMARLLEEAQRLPASAEPNSAIKQKQIIERINRILKSSILKDDEHLNKLIDNSKSRLNHEKVIVPFSRKNFIYDIDKMLKELPDKNLCRKMIAQAEKLPTSSNSLAAFIVKLRNESSERVAYKILDPSMASVEHILPASCGGPDEMKNFGCASRKMNTERGNMNFEKWLKRYPNIGKYCQRQVDKYIELANSGIFGGDSKKLQIIEDFKQSIKTQSNDKIILDTSRLNPPPVQPKSDCTVKKV